MFWRSFEVLTNHMFWCFDRVWRPEATREGQRASCCRPLSFGPVLVHTVELCNLERTSVICIAPKISKSESLCISVLHSHSFIRFRVLRPPISPLPARCPLPNDAASVFQPIYSHRQHDFVSEAKPTTRLSCPCIPKKVKTRRESHWAWQTWQTCLALSKTPKHTKSPRLLPSLWGLGGRRCGDVQSGFSRWSGLASWWAGARLCWNVGLQMLKALKGLHFALLASSWCCWGGQTLLAHACLGSVYVICSCYLSTYIYVYDI